MKVSIKDLIQAADTEPAPAPDPTPKPRKKGGDHERVIKYAQMGTTAIDAHPERDEIRRLLATREASDTEIASRFGMHARTVGRYRKQHMQNVSITEPGAIVHGREVQLDRRKFYEDLALDLHAAEKEATQAMIARAKESGDFSLVEKLITGGKLGQQLDRAAEFAGVRWEGAEHGGAAGMQGQRAHGMHGQGGLSNVNVIVIPKDIPGHDLYPPAIDGWSEESEG